MAKTFKNFKNQLKTLTKGTNKGRSRGRGFEDYDDECSESIIEEERNRRMRRKLKENLNSQW